MTGRRRLGLVAVGATLLAAAPLASIFESWVWLMQTLLALVLIAGAAVGARTLRFPTWAQTLCMIVALVLALTWIFPSGKEILIPQPATFAHFADLIRQAGEDARSYGVPVPDRDGLHFVTVLGIGAVAIVVDLLTAVFRRPALAGLPMLAIYSIPVAVYLNSVPVLPFIIGAAGYMWLLVADNVDRVRRFGRRFTGDGRDVDVWEPSPLAAAGRRIGVLGVLVAVLLPLAVPTVSGGLLSRLTQSGSGAGPGLGGSGGGRINLFAALSGQLNQTATVNIIKVTTNEPEPFYLRFGVADVLTTDGFSNQTPKGRSLAEPLPDPRQAAARASFAEYRAEVQISNALRQSMAPLYPYPTSVNDITGNWLYDANQQVLFSGRTTTGEQEYSFTYQRPKYNRQQLRTAQPLAGDNPLLRYTESPEDASVQALVDRLTRDAETEYDKVRAIYESFSAKNGFRYDLATESTGNATDIAAFLKNKVGYCQQYAAAMAWMVRVAGIPARVAFGFTRGNSLGNGQFQITNKNAHAWTEVYLDGFGWVPFDATPAAGVPGSTRTAWAQDVDRPEPTATASADENAPGTDSSAAPNTPNRPEDGNDGGSSLAGDGVVPDDGSWTGAMIAGGVVLAIALLLIPALRRVLLRRRRNSVTAGLATATATVAGGDAGPAGSVTDIAVTSDSVHARADAHAAWDELIDTMIDFRVPVDPTETPRHTAQRLIRETELAGDAAEAATLLGTAEERARYARRPLQGAELAAALKRVRSGVLETAPFRTRMQALLLPPSVLLHWRLATAEWSTRAAEQLTRMRDSLSRFNPRRLLSRAR